MKPNQPASFTNARCFPLLLLVVALFAVACDSKDNTALLGKSAQAATIEASREPIQPLPAVPRLDPKVVALGKRLFNDKRLSGNDSLACASCHDLARGGADNAARSLGAAGKPGAVNALTVYNAALNFVQFWDGRAPTLEAQAGGPVTDPLEMNARWEDVLEKLRSDGALVADFREAFPDGLTETNIRKAIADFERTLITCGSSFDEWLSGNEAALSSDARAGYTLFKSLGCVACHQGANVGGNMYQRFGVFRDYFKDRGDITEADYGRFNVTKNEDDRFVFRVPSLRYAIHTAPYFHDGTGESLEDAIQTMATYQLGRQLDAQQVDRLAAFLASLAGPLPVE